MKVKSVLAGLLLMVTAGFAQAQEGWKWPSDTAKEATARGYNAAYVDYMKSDQFVEATKGLHWLLTNAPDLNESIYINGVIVYNGAANATTDAAQKRVYQDSVMKVYELRKQYFDNESRWIEAKAYYAYQYYRSDRTKLAEAISFYERAFEVNGTINYPYTAAYFDLVRRHYQANKALSDDQVLAVYEKLSKIIDDAEAAGKDVSDTKDNMESLLVALELIDCDFIENKFGPRLAADPANMQLAQQIFKYSIQYKCTSTSAFNAALEVIDTNSPTFSTSQVRAMRLMQNREYDKAQPILEKAMSLASNNTQKAEVQLDLAKVYAQLGRKTASRAAALEAAKLDSDKTKDAWNLIGSLYMGSFNDCRRNVSRAEDQAIFIAAYNAFQRAGNSEGMRDARARFPSKEELFTEGKQAGETVSVGCWIGETVTLSTRD